MKYKDTEKLKAGDKIVVEIEAIFENGHSIWVDGKRLGNDAILGKLEDFQPVEKKIKMTVEEKKEFDSLMGTCTELYSCLSIILSYDDAYPLLHKRLFNNDLLSDNKAQLEFARAWENPSLIEVVPEKKYYISILNNYYLYFDIENKIYWISEARHCVSGVQDTFTQSEIDEMQALQKFKAIDLNKCKEEIVNEKENN